MLSRLLRTTALVAVALATLVLATTEPVAATGTALAREYELKAAFLCNFTAFVEWPPSALEDASGTFVVGVLGNDPFGSVLDEIAEVKTTHGTPIVVHRFATLDDYTPCHILFVAASERERLPTVLEKLGDSPVLIVGDTKGFAQAGGTVNLVIEKNKIRFEINLTAATRAGLKISSKLLRLAKNIFDKETTS